MRALIEGTRATTLAYRAWRRSPVSAFDDAVGLPMTVKVELQGEPYGDRPVFDGCVWRLLHDVEVTLSFDEPALDVVIDAIAYVYSSTSASIGFDLGRDLAEALGLPPSDIISVALRFDESGMKGSFYSEGDECGRAVFPASVRCEGGIEVELDRQRPGVRPLPALSMLVEELRDVPLEWSDGSQTTLAISLVEAPEWACSDNRVESFCAENLQIPVSVRAVTADGRLDAELPAELSLNVATETSAMDASSTEPFCGVARTAGEIEALTLRAEYFGAAAGGPGPEVIPPLEADTGFALYVWSAFLSSDRAAESSPDRTAEIRLFATERRDAGLRPPLDATIDPASASCVVFDLLGAVEDSLGEAEVESR